MPSTKNPADVVNPGPGKLSPGVASASSFIFPGGGGGSDAALHAHIVDPVDAHMAGAIGILPTDPVTGLPILASANGPIDGESVFDFIVAAKDLFPVRPNVLGYARAGVPNTGVPDWDTLAEYSIDPTGTAVTGGFTRGSAVIPTHFVVPTASSSAAVAGTLYPADRGILAVYFSTDGNFLNPATTSLIGALWLNSMAVPAGLPTAAYDEVLRAEAQLDHTATGTGLDIISLTHRLPYVKDYTPYGAYYVNYDANFYRYQLAHFAFSIPSIANRDSGSWLVVHWRETYATKLVRIQPLAMSTHLTSGYCYSAMPVGGSFDVAEVRTVNRHHVYREIDYATPGSGAYTNAVVSTPTTVNLSGVAFYSNGATPLHWDLDVRVTNLLSNSYFLGTVAQAGALPAGFESTVDPMTIDFADFGGGVLPVPYYHLRNVSTLTPYSLTSPPSPGDVNRYHEANVSIYGTPVYASPVGGYGLIRGLWHKPFISTVPWAAPTRYLFNSYPQTGGTTAATAIYESFTDERFRYTNAVTPVATLSVEPSSGNHYNPATVLTSGDGNLQVIGHQLVYPHADFSSGHMPVSQPNYAAVLSSDPASHLRGYVRAFDTGIPRNTGKLRIRGLSYADIASISASPSSVTDGHTNGAIVLLKVPGQTGWLDLGRSYGVPDLDTSQDNRGCQTGVAPNTTATDFTVTFNTGSFTANNGAGEYLLFMKVYLFKNGVGELKVIDDITWEAP